MSKDCRCICKGSIGLKGPSPTIEVEVWSEYGGYGSAMVPSRCFR